MTGARERGVSEKIRKSAITGEMTERGDKKNKREYRVWKDSQESDSFFQRDAVPGLFASTETSTNQSQFMQL